MSWTNLAKIPSVVTIIYANIIVTFRFDFPLRRHTVVFDLGIRICYCRNWALPRECGIDMPFIAKRMWNRHAFHCQENVKSTCLSPLKYKTIKWFTFTFTLIYICTFYSLDCIRPNENNNTYIWMGLIQIKVACICTGSTNNILVESYSTLSVKELVPVSIKDHSLLVVYFWISWQAIMNRSWMWWTYVYCYLYWNKM